jgi:hypothetical protein
MSAASPAPAPPVGRALAGLAGLVLAAITIAITIATAPRPP